MAAIHELIGRLDKCREVAVNKHDQCWSACCPAHSDKSPSLSVALTHDGKILLKCWAGCGYAEICAAVGIEPTDLFPEGARRRSYDPSEDEWAVMVGDAQVKRGRPLSDADKARYRAALSRISNNKPSPKPAPDHVIRGAAAVGKREAERMAVLRGKSL